MTMIALLGALVPLLLTVVSGQPHCQGLCDNGGTCKVSANGIQCVCPSGFTGPTCSEVDGCSEDPCGEHGECEGGDDGGDIACRCQEDFFGLNCELPVDQQCNQEEDSFCTCEVDGNSVKIPLRPPPSSRPGPKSRDFIMGITGLLIGWAAGAGGMTLYRCCCHGTGCQGGEDGIKRRPKPMPVEQARPASVTTAMSSLDSLSLDSPADSPYLRQRPSALEIHPGGGRRWAEDGGVGGAATATAPSERPINVYRAGFSDVMAHQTAVRKSGSTYASGNKDW